MCVSPDLYYYRVCVLGISSRQEYEEYHDGDATKLKSGKYGGDYQQARTRRPPP